jgi:hypothetical protein
MSLVAYRGLATTQFARNAPQGTSARQSAQLLFLGGGPKNSGSLRFTCWHVVVSLLWLYALCLLHSLRAQALQRVDDACVLLQTQAIAH